MVLTEKKTGFMLEGNHRSTPKDCFFATAIYSPCLKQHRRRSTTRGLHVIETSTASFNDCPSSNLHQYYN